jgi:hypothetical protein
VGKYTDVIDKIYDRIKRQNDPGGFMFDEICGIYRGQRRFAPMPDIMPLVMIYIESSSQLELNKKTYPDIKCDFTVFVRIDVYGYNSDIDKGPDSNKITNSGGLLELCEKIHDSIYTKADDENDRGLSFNGPRQLNIVQFGQIPLDQEGIQGYSTLLECSTATFKINERRL